MNTNSSAPQATTETSLTPIEQFLFDMAEPSTTHIRWWALIVGVVGVVTSLLITLTLSTPMADVARLALGASVFFSLVVGVVCLARFILDCGMLARARSIQRHAARAVTEAARTSEVATSSDAGALREPA